MRWLLPNYLRTVNLSSFSGENKPTDGRIIGTVEYSLRWEPPDNFHPASPACLQGKIKKERGILGKIVNRTCCLSVFFFILAARLIHWLQTPCMLDHPRHELWGKILLALYHYYHMGLGFRTQAGSKSLDSLCITLCSLFYQWFPQAVKPLPPNAQINTSFSLCFSSGVHQLNETSHMTAAG